LIRADNKVSFRKLNNAVVDRTIFLGFNALGDTLCSTPTVRAYRQQHPEAHITYVTQHASYTRVLDNNPDIDLILYSEFMAMNGLSKFSIDWLYTLPLDFTVPAMLYIFDITQVCTTHEAFQSHISSGFSRLLKIPISSIKPVIKLTTAEEKTAKSLIQEPYAVISKHSNSNPARKDGQGNAKDWPEDRWQKLCRYLQSRGIKKIISVGSEFDPQTRVAEWTNYYGLPIRLVAGLLKHASCVVTLENGLGHLAHAVDAPIVMIYSDIVPLGWANPSEATNREVLYGDPHQTSLEDVVFSVDKVLARALHSQYNPNHHANMLL
jgi:ADP-heptose:LPS heptosyltransferase